MTKAELINQIAIETGYDKTTISVVVEGVMENVKKSLKNEENVYLRGFGTFSLKKRAAKVARNITKHTSIRVPAHKIVSFKPAVELAGEIRKL